MKKYQFMKDVDENGKETVVVSHKPRRRLDLFARLVCLLAAVFIWLWIVNFNQNDATETFVLKIDYVGLEDLEDRGMMIYGIDKSEITVTIRGSNSSVNKYKNPGVYSVVADLSAVNEPGIYTLPLTVNTPADIKVTVETSTSLNVSFTCDRRVQKEINLEINPINKQDNAFFSYTYNYELSESTMAIEGPQSIIDSIDRARFDANCNFVIYEDERTYDNFPLTFLDKNLNAVQDKGMVEYSTEDIVVNVIATAHASVPINVRVEGSEQGDLIYTQDLTSIVISGAPSAVREVSEYVLVIEAPKIGDTVQKVLDNESLPEGVYVEAGRLINITFKNIEQNENNG